MDRLSIHLWAGLEKHQLNGTKLYSFEIICHFMLSTVHSYFRVPTTNDIVIESFPVSNHPIGIHPKYGADVYNWLNRVWTCELRAVCKHLLERKCLSNFYKTIVNFAFFSRWIFEWRLKNFERFSSSIFCTFTFILFLLLENSNQFWLILLFVLYFFQLIGWQEVPRPNSRSEIVQAMRQIRVCIAKWMSISLLQIIQQQQKQ